MAPIGPCGDSWELRKGTGAWTGCPYRADGRWRVRVPVGSPGRGDGYMYRMGGGRVRWPGIVDRAREIVEG
jgi:hypothetical protein